MASPLLDHIRSLIEKQGPLSLARYMELALQHPEWGYYKKGDPLGAGGDFITAPEISQMFGELIGLSLAEAWKTIGKPDPFVMLELGPGRGTLMQDALRATAKIHGFHTAMDLCLVESNQTLREQQEEKLAGHHPRYIDNLEQLPPHPAFIIANEFFDALPVRQFENTADGWRERLVTADGDELEFVLSPPDPAFRFLIPEELHEAPGGTTHEISLSTLILARQIANHVGRYDGAALIIDYGYAAPPGKGTVQATSSHRHADILERPGEVDITAHVDFSALKHWAVGQGTAFLGPIEHGKFLQTEEAAILGPVTQGEYLETLGIEMRAMQLKHNATPEQSAAIDAALRRLTDSAEMGALFKAMAIVSAKLGTLAGF